jgi:hypothetical protein
LNYCYTCNDKHSNFCKANNSTEHAYFLSIHIHKMSRMSMIYTWYPFEFCKYLQFSDSYESLCCPS